VSALDIALGGLLVPITSMCVATQGLVCYGAVVVPPGPYEPPPPGSGIPAEGIGTAPGVTGGGWFPAWQPTIIFEPHVRDEDEEEPAAPCVTDEEDLPLHATYLIAERLSKVAHRKLVFRLAWRMRKPRR
jgi:hypothetical protein